MNSTFAEPLRHGQRLPAPTLADVPALLNDQRQRVRDALDRIQPKLVINTPGDAYEQEADRIADQIVRMETPHAPQTRPALAPLSSFNLQREQDAPQEEEEAVQRIQQCSVRRALTSAANSASGFLMRTPSVDIRAAARAKRVKVTVTGTQGGTWGLYPYNPQFHRDTRALYWVPVYLVKVEGSAEATPATFRAIRFGIPRPTPDYRHPPPRLRCTSGLLSGTARPWWVANYSLQSSRSGARTGGWLLWPKDQRLGNYFIHMGSPNRNQGFGSYGCIEIVGPGKWNEFNETIEKAAGAKREEIAYRGKLTVILENTPYPWATRNDTP